MKKKGKVFRFLSYVILCSIHLFRRRKREEEREKKRQERELQRQKEEEANLKEVIKK